MTARIVCLMVLALGGCAAAAPSNITARLDAIDKKLEPETDAIAAFIAKRGCSAGVDILNRNLKTDDKLEGAYLICKDRPLGLFVDRMVGVVNRRNDMLKEPPAPGTAPMTGS